MKYVYKVDKLLFERHVNSIKRNTIKEYELYKSVMKWTLLGNCVDFNDMFTELFSLF